eukprot:TRINITY_DN67071_c3_g1_i1.p1 TRINITY_DN67071_c3_g1~~TRINITY_DN67071_c3_g1_i1.p1  ORF type:complete len:316 (+),score=41.45 TRINITY_DN67071_c3_g1_i1:19-966(+)
MQGDFYGSQVWQYLDQLSNKNPEQYQNFMKETFQGCKEYFQKAPKMKKNVTPVWSIKCPRHDESILYITICHSNEMEPFVEEDNQIPISFSERINNHVDACVHTSVIKRAKQQDWFRQDLIDIILLGYMDETTDRVITSKAKIDNTLQPSVMLGQVGPAAPKPQPKEKSVATDSVVSALKNIDQQTEPTPPPPSGLVVEATSSAVTATQTTEEITIAETSNTEQHKTAPDTGRQCPEVLECNFDDQGDSLVVDVKVTCTSAADMDLTLEGNSLKLTFTETGNQMDLGLPCAVDGDEYKAKFLKKKGVLRLTLKKI